MLEPEVWPPIVVPQREDCSSPSCSTLSSSALYRTLWLPVGILVLWQSIFFFKFVSPILGLPSYQAWALAMKKFRAWGKRIFFFFFWSQGTVAPVAIVFTQYLFLKNIYILSNRSKLPTSLKDMRNGKKQQEIPNVFVCPGLRASHCLTLADLELLPQLPETLERYLMYTTTLALHSKCLQFHLCVPVTECSTLLLRSTSSYPGHLLFFSSPWYQHLLVLRMSFCFLLVLRSEVGTGEEERSWRHFCTWNR